MKRPILLDGPMGTEIDRRGGDTSVPLWSARALFEQPQLVKEIHRDYIKSGAEIITTNTFRTQGYTLQKAGVHSHTAESLTKRAVSLGRSAINESNKEILLAGSIAPVEDCYSPHLTPNNPVLEKEHRRMASNLYEGGVDLFLVETMNTLREAQIAVEAASTYDLPIYLSFTLDNNGQVLGGDKWTEIIAEFSDQVELLMINCTSMEGTLAGIRNLQELNINNWGVYPNFGEIHAEKGWTSHPINPEYIDTISGWLGYGPKLIGTCCGATPVQTDMLRKRISEYQY